MGIDPARVIISLSKMALRAKRRKTESNSILKNKQNIYQLCMDHTFRTYETLPKSGYKSYLFEGEPVQNRNFSFLVPSEHQDEINKPLGDVFSVEVSSFILNEYAFAILYPQIKDDIQVFKIKNRNSIFYVINVTNVIDCLDYDKSEIKRFPSSGRAMDVKKYAFRKSKLKNEIIFKLPEFANRKIFVTETFKKAVTENNIKGFKFTEIAEEENRNAF